MLCIVRRKGSEKTEKMTCERPKRMSVMMMHVIKKKTGSGRVSSLEQPALL